MACPVFDDHLSFQQRKPDSLRSHVCAPSAKNPSSLTRVFGTERKKWKRNAARNRWFLDLLRAISVCPKTGLNVALPLRLTRSAAHSYGNVEVPASTFLRKSGSAKRSRRQCYICTTERFSFQFAWKLLLCFAFPAREKDALKPWFQRAFLVTFSVTPRKYERKRQIFGWWNACDSAQRLVLLVTKVPRWRPCIFRRGLPRPLPLGRGGRSLRGLPPHRDVLKAVCPPLRQPIPGRWHARQSGRSCSRWPSRFSATSWPITGGLP